MPELRPLRSGYYVWHYVPSIAASIIFFLLFLSATSFHFWKIWKLKSRMMLAFTIGGVLEFIGYVVRASAYNNTDRLMPFCIQSMFLLVGPILFTASVYMVLGRIIRKVGAEHHSLIRVNWLTKTFVISDVATFCIQGGGAGMLVVSSLANIGKIIVIAGLILQVLGFCLFIVTSMVFQMRISRYPTRESVDPAVQWKKYLYSLYAVSVLITVRSLFRVVEYIMGQNGYLMSHEWCLYTFDGVPMLFCMVIFGIWYPGEVCFIPKVNLAAVESFELKSFT
ncbi:RTA1 like protein-domain-containing protein [Lipomyces starkeyi]